MKKRNSRRKVNPKNNHPNVAGGQPQEPSILVPQTLPVELGAPVRLPPTVEDYYRSENNLTATREKRAKVALWIQGIGLLAAMALGFLTLQAIRATREANDIARTNFKQDQRPYVWYSGVRDQPHWFQSSGQVAWTWNLHNFGKTPAHGVTIRHWLTIGEGAPINIHSDQVIPGTPLMPNEDRFLTSGSDTSTPEENFKRILTTTDHVTLHAVIKYRDATGTTYETELCARHLANGPVQFCESGNDVK